MASVEASTYIAAVKWGDEGYYLKEFSQKFKLPQVAKIIKGQYQHLGVPTLPSPTLNQIVFVASAGPRLKVVAQCVKFKDAGRRMIPVGSKLSVPENFDGWFEILSEDGRSIKCMESVAEVVKRRPRSFLTRDPIKVHLPRPDDVSAVWDKTRTLSAGEVLEIGELISASNFRSSGSRTGKFLRCLTSLRESVYLPLELRGKFSNIAGEENISGVHSIRNLLTKRFPIMVRLVHGKPPVGIKSGSQFTPEMRLFSLVEEESLVAMPLSKNAEAVALPPNAPLKILAPRNADLLSKLQEHEILANRCRSVIAEVTDSIQVCDTSASREIKHVPSSPQYVYTRRRAPTAYRTIPLVKRSASDPQGTNNPGRMHLERGHSIPAEPQTTSKSEFSEISDPDDYRYQEIDQIYDYVRGFAPLPANLKNDFSLYDNGSKTHQSLPQITQLMDSTNNNKTEKKPPEPPPIDTIPARKLSNGTVRPPHKITVSIVNRNSRAKDTILPSHNHRIRKLSDDHVYERIDKRKSGLKTVRGLEATIQGGPTRSNSASKVFLQSSFNVNSVNNSKPFTKGHSQRHSHPSQVNQLAHPPSKYRFQKHVKSSAVAQKEIPNINKHITKFNKTTSGNVPLRNVTTSPLFHIRYKSLTDLLMDGNKSSPDSSNKSSGKKMEGSASTCSSTSSTEELNGVADYLLNDDEELEVSGPKNSHAKRRLSRPKSLSNLINNVAPRRRVDNHNYYNLVQNDLIRIPDFSNPKFYSMPDATKYAKNHYGIAAHNKKLGTLYL